MAEKRMFTKKITESDAFLDMPASSQMLYFHLNMSADDEGFVNNPKKIQRMCGASDDDMKILVIKSFIIVFESGVIVIKHWKMHNYIAKDRFKPTDYQEELAMLGIKENKSYTLDKKQMYTECIQDVYTDKNSIDKNNKDKDILSELTKEIITYLNEKCGTNYRSSSTKTQGMIKARMHEGFSVEDFKIVIDKKVEDWGKDPRMQQYLRPETLFGTKFEGYLNQKGVKNGRLQSGTRRNDFVLTEDQRRTIEQGTEEDEYLSTLFG